MRRHTSRMHVFFVVFMTISLVGGAAFGQGLRSGVATALPPPISSADLVRLGATMNLTDEQQRAWSQMHDRYKADLKAMNEQGGAIAEFVAARTAAEGVPSGAQPPMAVIDRWISQHEVVFKRLAEIESRLFDELLPTLAEDQQPLLQRAKLARERARVSGDELVAEWLNSNTRTDLCAVFSAVETESLALAPDQRIQAWLALDPYQADWVRRLRAVQNDGEKMYRQWRKALDERGIGVNVVDMRRQRDDADMQIYFKIVEAYYELTRRIKPSLTEMSKVNRAKAKAVAALLPEQIGQRFMTDFMQSAYPTLPLFPLRDAEKSIRRAMGAKDLTLDERSALQNLMAECRRTMKEVGEQGADAEDMLQEGNSPGAIGASPQARQALMDVANASSQAAQRIEKSLNALIAPERLAKKSKAERDEVMRDMFRKGGVTDPEEIEEGLARLRSTGSVRFGGPITPDSAIPEAITTDDVTVLGRQLDLNDDTNAILAQLHRDYARLYRQRLNDHLTEFQSLALAGWSMRDDGHGNRAMGFAPPENVAKAKSMEAEAIAALRQLDRAFFDDAQAALASSATVGASGDSPADPLWRMRLIRDWDTFSRGERRGGDELRTYEAYVCLPRIVDGLALSADDAAKADAVFRAHGADWRSIAAAQFDAGRAAWFGRTLAMSLSEGQSPAPKDERDAQEREAAALESAAGEKRLALATLVHTMLDELIAALPEHAQALQDGFESAAFPHVFSDRRPPGEALTRALALDRLSDQQRSEIEAAAARYRPAYRDVCARMIQVNREWDKERPYSRFKTPEREAAKLKWNQLLFERDELNAGVNATLLRVLTAEQCTKAGVLISETK